MASSDSTVTARDVLRAVADVRRRGSSRAALEDLEHREPDLAEFVLEELTALYHDVLASGANPRKTRRLFRRFQTLAAVIILSLREAHARLWVDEAGGGGANGADRAKGRDEPREPDGPKGGA
jgi:hypothetical protein